MVCGVWCVVCGVECAVCGVWCAVCSKVYSLNIPYSFSPYSFEHSHLPP